MAGMGTLGTQGSIGTGTEVDSKRLVQRVGHGGNGSILRETAELADRIRRLLVELTCGSAVVARRDTYAGGQACSACYLGELGSSGARPMRRKRRRARGKEKKKNWKWLSREPDARDAWTCD